MLAILVGSIVLALFAGRRTGGRELDLAAMAWVPAVLVKTAGALAFTLLGRDPSPGELRVLDVLALGWAAGCWALALWTLRNHRDEHPAGGRVSDRSPPPAPPEPPPAAPRPPDRPARTAGALVLVLLLVLVALRITWIAGHAKAIAPVGGGDTAPAFTLPLLGGGEFVYAPGQVPGQVVVLDFWATWCEPCRIALPHIDALHRRYRDRGVRFVAVDTEGPEARPAVEALVRSLGLQLPVALDGDEVSGHYKVTSLPTTVIVGRDGTIAKAFLGVHSEEELARVIDRALGP